MDISRNLIIVDNKYYDITEFINSHPGGKQCLLKNINKDCTEHMKYHSKEARKIMKKMLIKK